MAAPRLSEHRLRRRVHFYEADPAGIVHFSCFFRYMEEAEHALWREAGLSPTAPEADVTFPRVAATFDYRQPLRFDEEFEVHLRIAAIGTTSIRYACDVIRGETRIAAGAMTVVCVRRRAGEPLTPTPIPPDITSRLGVAPSAAPDRAAP